MGARAMDGSRQGPHARTAVGTGGSVVSKAQTVQAGLRALTQGTTKGLNAGDLGSAVGGARQGRLGGGGGGGGGGGEGG